MLLYGCTPAMRPARGDYPHLPPMTGARLVEMTTLAAVDPVFQHQHYVYSIQSPGSTILTYYRTIAPRVGYEVTTETSDALIAADGRFCPTFEFVIQILNEDATTGITTYQIDIIPDQCQRR